MIYVCESGCKYEGGAAFFASTNYLLAWKEMRKKRLEKTNNLPILKDKDYWESEYDYFIIRSFEGCNG